MTENKAHVLVVAIGVVALFPIVIGLRQLGVRDELITLALILDLAISSFSVGMVGVHFDPDCRSRKRR
jgi:hypothetical protein